jgi:hypothetical protein
MSIPPFITLECAMRAATSPALPTSDGSVCAEFERLSVNWSKLSGPPTIAPGRT